MRIESTLGLTCMSINQTSMRMVNEATSCRLSSTQHLEQILSQI